jgi:hypothetical protein
MRLCGAIPPHGAPKAKREKNRCSSVQHIRDARDAPHHTVMSPAVVYEHARIDDASSARGGRSGNRELLRCLDLSTPPKETLDGYEARTYPKCDPPARGEMPQNLFKEALRAALSEFMELEVSALCNAAYGERHEEPQNARNGYRDRELETRLGTLQVAVPRVRRGTYFPGLPRRSPALGAGLRAGGGGGLRAGRLNAEGRGLVEGMAAEGMSKSEVSRMAAVLDEQVKAFRERPLEKPYPYLWLDALYVKVR